MSIPEIFCRNLGCETDTADVTPETPEDPLEGCTCYVAYIPPVFQNAGGRSRIRRVRFVDCHASLVDGVVFCHGCALIFCHGSCCVKKTYLR